MTLSSALLLHRTDRWRHPLQWGRLHAAYFAYLILSSTGHGALASFCSAMLIFVMPVAAFFVAAAAVRGWCRRRSRLP